MLYLLNYEIKYLLLFFNFAESACSDKSKFCDYFGTFPFKFSDLSK